MQNIIKRAIGFHKGLLLTLMALTLALSASAQTKITGRVVDENGQPAIGANIIVSGTTQGASADVDGKFTLSVKKNATLIVSYLGYKTQEVKVRRPISRSSSSPMPTSWMKWSSWAMVRQSVPT